MNILPHKSWHVRTKKNIARVRKDEAQAAEAEKERQRKIALASQEARTAALRQRASARLSDAVSTSNVSSADVSIPLAPVTDIVATDGHVNFFQDVDDGRRQGGVNPDAVAEDKKEQEDYEKKIGYLVYLGQDSLEATKAAPWYAKIQRGGPESTGSQEFQKLKQFEDSGYLEGQTRECKLTPEELKLAKFKSFQDPLKDIRKFLKIPAKDKDKSKGKPKEKDSKEKSKSHKKKSKKHSKHKKSKKSKRSRPSSSSESSESEDSGEERKRKSLEKLRAERLEREREERRRTEQLLAKLRGDEIPQKSKEMEEKEAEIRKPVSQKYNSQFNPELARQNYNF